jgi:TrmH family RNA methyltransferase
VVLVEPKYDGNIGATARAMKNFGFSNLVLINPCEIGTECYQRAMHAEDIISNVRTFQTLDEYLDTVQVVVGTSGILNLNEKAYIRNPVSPEELAGKLIETDESVAILLGREDIGLLRTELSRCDLVVTIPTSEEYPVMNISHAAAVILYELSICELKVPKARGMTKQEKEKFFEMFDKLLKSIDYPEHKYENTRVLFRRLIGRAMPTAWEFHTLMGVLVRAGEYADSSTIERKNEKGNDDI